MSRISPLALALLTVLAGCGGDPQGLDASAVGACLSSDQNIVRTSQPLNAQGQARYIVKFKSGQQLPLTSVVSGAVSQKRLGLGLETALMTPQAAMALAAAVALGFWIVACKVAI